MVWKDYKLVCQEVDYSENGIAAAETSYFYFILKFTEFIDTVRPAYQPVKLKRGHLFSTYASRGEGVLAQ